MTPNHSESQVDNGSGWCLLCIWMGRLHLSWLWTAMTEERALHKTWNIGPLYSECFSEYILFLPDDLVPQDLFFFFMQLYCSFLQSVNKDRNCPRAIWAVRWELEPWKLEFMSIFFLKNGWVENAVYFYRLACQWRCHTMLFEPWGQTLFLAPPPPLQGGQRSLTATVTASASSRWRASIFTDVCLSAYKIKLGFPSSVRSFKLQSEWINSPVISVSCESLTWDKWSAKQFGH